MTEEPTRTAEAPSRTATEGDGPMESLLQHWDGEEVIVRFDHPSGSWMVIAIHSTQPGPAGGGTRMKSYPDLGAAVDDALRLSAGMTAKFAIAGFPRGGGKAVIAVPPGLDERARHGLLRRYGALVHQLGGLFTTAADVGTSSADMDIIAETGAPYVYSRTPEGGGSGDSGAPTALGVYHGIRATVERLFGDDSLAGKQVLIQGLGNVGRPLLGHLARAGAVVLVSDVNSEALDRIERSHDIRRVDPEAVYDTPCDVFAPCALGGVLNRNTIPRLRCRAVAGSANNQLQTPEDATRLRERGILYAPDFVVNVGGALSIVGIEGMGWSRVEVERRIVETVTQTLREIFDLAAAEDITTSAAADRVAGSRRRDMQPA